jgi:hypothetical protein
MNGRLECRLQPAEFDGVYVHSNMMVRERSRVRVGGVTTRKTARQPPAAFQINHVGAARRANHARLPHRMFQNDPKWSLAARDLPALRLKAGVPPCL